MDFPPKCKKSLKMIILYDYLITIAMIFTAVGFFGGDTLVVRNFDIFYACLSLMNIYKTGILS